MPWFGYDTINRGPVFHSNEIWRDCDQNLNGAKLTDENLTIGHTETIGPVLNHMVVTERQSMVSNVPGVHLLRLSVNGHERMFAYVQEHQVQGNSYRIDIVIKENADPTEQRTKIQVVTDIPLQKNMLYYEVPGCPIPFYIPEIPFPDFNANARVKQTAFFVIKTPINLNEIQFKLREFVVPNGAETFPEGKSTLKHNIVLRVNGTEQKL